jgi:transposase
VIGATSMLRYARAKTAPGAEWVNRLLERRPARLVTVTMANKTARIAWAVLARQKTYRAPAVATNESKGIFDKTRPWQVEVFARVKTI